MSLSYVYNPLSGQLDLVNKSGGGGISAPEPFAGYREIQEGEEITVIARTEMRIRSHIKNQGVLKNFGRVVVD